MNRPLSMALASTAVAAGLLLFGTGPAAAATMSSPAGYTCSINIQDSQIGVLCTFPGPTGTRFQAWADCTDNREHDGPWEAVNSGIWSWAHCPTNQFVTNYGFRLR